VLLQTVPSIGRIEVPKPVPERGGNRNPVADHQFARQNRTSSAWSSHVRSGPMLPLHDGVRSAELLRLAGIEGCMNTAEHDERSAVSCQSPNFKSTQFVGALDADSNHIAGLYVLGTNGFKSLIDDNGIPVLQRV